MYKFKIEPDEQTGHYLIYAKKYWYSKYRPMRLCHQGYRSSLVFTTKYALEAYGDITTCLKLIYTSFSDSSKGPVSVDFGIKLNSTGFVTYCYKSRFEYNINEKPTREQLLVDVHTFFEEKDL